MKSFFYQQLNEELLVEKKLQDTYKQRLEKVVNGDLLYKQIVSADPTAQGNEGQESGDYINWIANYVLQFIERGKEPPVFGVIRENLKRFEIYKQWWRRNKAKVKREEEEQNAIHRQINPDLPTPKIPSFDINQYKGLHDLAVKLESIYDFIKQYGYDESSAEWAKDKIKEVKEEKHTRYLYKDDRYEFLNPLSHSSACFWGLGTKWCTSSKGDEGFYNNYTNTDDLYILIDKKEGKKYQFHVPTGQYMNADDSSIVNYKIFKDLPDGLKLQLKKMFDDGSSVIDSIEMEYESQIEEEVLSLRSDIDNDNAEIAKLERMKDKLEKELEDLKNSEDDEDGENEDQIKAIEEELDDLNDRIGELETNISEYEEKINDLENDGEFEYNGKHYTKDDFDMEKHELVQFRKTIGA